MAEIAQNKIEETQPLLGERQSEDTEGEGAENSPPSNGSGGEYGSMSSRSVSAQKSPKSQAGDPETGTAHAGDTSSQGGGSPSASCYKAAKEDIALCYKDAKEYIKLHWIHFLLGLLIVLLGGGSRAVCSVTRWVEIHECHNNATSNSTDVYYKFTAALYGVIGILHSIAILVIAINYFIDRKEWNERDIKYWKWLPWLLLVILIILSVAITAIGLAFDLQLDHCFTRWYHLPTVCIYHCMVIVTNLVISIVLHRLVYATVCVYYIWKPIRAPEENEGKRGSKVGRKGKSDAKPATGDSKTVPRPKEVGDSKPKETDPETVPRPKEVGDSQPKETDSETVPRPIEVSDSKPKETDSETVPRPKEVGDFKPVPVRMYCGYCKDYLELKTRASLSYSEICYKYRNKGKEVIPFTSTFQSWFVLQWFIYFLGIFIDLTFVVRPWILGGNVHDSVEIYKQHPLEYAYISMFIVYDITVFIIPFVCGIKMNKYHDGYYSKLVKAKENNFDFLADDNQKGNGALEYALNATVLKVQKVQEFDFTPTISGIDIPLTNPGYILSIVIAMVALILGFLVNPLDQKN